MSRDVEMVCLTGPAKIDGRWRRLGERVEVDEVVRAQLATAGAIDAQATGGMELVPGGTGFDEAVAAMAKALADAAVAAAVEVATTGLTEERDFYRTGLENSQAELRSAQATNHELEAEIVELKEREAAAKGNGSAEQSPPPKEAADKPAPEAPAAQPARKKATTTKG